MAFTSAQTFEPRVGTAQLVFGVIYLLITLVALSLAFYVRSTGQEPYIHYFMAGLFAIMAVKSFVIAKRIRTLLASGEYAEAEVSSCEAVRGITIIRGTIEVEGYGKILIESRLVGEKIAHEINQYLSDHQQKQLPALVVAKNTRRPRGMFTVKGLSGHLVEESAMLKGETKESVEQKKEENLAFAQDTERAKAETKKQEQELQSSLQDEAAPAEVSALDAADSKTEDKAEAKANATADSAAATAESAATEASEQVASVAPRDEKRDEAIMEALKAKESSTKE